MQDLQLPQPSSPAFTDAVFDAALPAIEASGGGVFMLCTTLRAVDRIASKLRDVIESRGWNTPLLVQGDASRTELLDRFRSYGNAILVGSQSFWEGVDVRGDALSLVVIDKLPFAPHTDPLIAARMQLRAEAGEDPFAAIQLPAAAIALKQGFGRLIRRRDDRGIVAILDGRIVTRTYGRVFLDTLPAGLPRTSAIEQVRRWWAVP